MLNFLVVISFNGFDKNLLNVSYSAGNFLEWIFYLNITWNISLYMHPGSVYRFGVSCVLIYNARLEIFSDMKFFGIFMVHT